MNAQFPPPSKTTKIEELLILEAKVREASSLAELQFLIANETKKIISCRQVLVHRGSPWNAGWRIEKISSISQVDRTAPTIKYLETEIKACLKNDNWDRKSPLTISLQNNGNKNYPYKKGIYVPFSNRQENALGGMTILSEKAISNQDISLLVRLASCYQHAWDSLKPRSASGLYLLSKRNFLIAISCLALLGFIPVPLTVLAPVEVVARDAFLITAPLEGVLDEVHVAPNMEVKKGQILITYNALDLKNNFDLASRNMEIASARFKRASQSSFGVGEGRRELAITKAEYEVALEEKSFAKEQLSRVEVKSPRQGVVLFSSKDDWIGRPVSIGERIMRVADPQKVEFKIKLPVGDAIMLEQDISARIFLDSAPLHPVDAEITLKSYMAEKSGDEPLAFPVIATAINSNKKHDEGVKLRIGLRGTAQVSGKNVPLAFNLFKKPLSAIRQYLGI